MDWNILIIVVVLVLAFFALKRSSFIPVETGRKHLSAGALVIDVRSTDEFRSGHVANAVNVPLGELRKRVPQLVKDRNQVLLLHCLSGGRSAIATYQLKRMGYVNVFNLGSFHRAEQIVSVRRNQ